MMRVGVDVGGTFTDAVAWLPDGSLRTGKTLTTPGHLSRGFLTALQETTGGTSDVEFLVHGTTAVLNAVLTGDYPTTALVTTAGFRDVLEIMRGDRKDLFDITQRKPRPLVARPLRFELEERIGAGGEVVDALEDEHLATVAAAVVESGAEAVAICLLNSFANPVHEQAMSAALRERAPGLRVSTSHEVLPVFREFERTSTTVVNALALPLMSDYLEVVLDDLARQEFVGQFAMMQSSGGLADPSEVRRRPVATLFSGPAGGVICAQAIGAAAGMADVFNFDMGGTSCDVAAITDAEPDRVLSFEIGGYPVQMPSLDIVSVGAGGGSIAWVDAGGGLQVGPHSAGADPGPACYGRGGKLATVTDAAVVLGRYNPSAALAGALPIHYPDAYEALAELGRAIDGSAEETAWGILRLVNANMANAVREVSVERGRDPRTYALVAAGGGGPAHAVEVGRELGIQAVLVPPFPGVASAQGMLLADVRHEHIRTVYRHLVQLDHDELSSTVKDLVAKVVGQVETSSVTCSDIIATVSADLRYRNQAWSLNVPLAQPVVDPASLAIQFHDAHRKRYGHAFESAEVELVNLRVAAVGKLASPAAGDPEWIDFPEARRKVHWGSEWGWIDTPISSRGHLVRRGSSEGPLIVEQSDATVVVPPDARAEALPGGILKITSTGAPAFVDALTAGTVAHAR